MITVKIQNFSKRLEAWVTKLRINNFFLWTRLKLAVLYFLTTVLLFVSTYLIFQVGGNLGSIFGFNPILFDTVLNFILFLSLLYFLTNTVLTPMKEVMESQKRFISSASHELRTPLSVMKTSNEVALMRADDITKDELVDALEENIEEINRMSDVIAMLLQMENLDLNTVNPIRFSKTDLTEIVERAIYEVKKLIEDKNITLKTYMVDDAVIWGNPSALHTMVLNILHNAATYTPKNGKIRISLRYTKKMDCVKLRVKDSGVGISKKEIPFIFHPFYRTIYGKEFEKDGHFGLGLSLVSKVVENHKGSIEINTEEGKGSEFIIKLPASLKKYNEVS